jgi:heme oxygenase
MQTLAHMSLLAPDSAMTPDLATPNALIDRLRQHTRVLHREAERAGAMGALLRQELPHGAYLRLLQQLHALYGSLERACSASSSQPWLASMDPAAWMRSHALREDLGELDGDPTLEPSTQTYVRRLDALAAGADPALLGHVYVRCLGDLHGGQVLAAWIRRVYPGQSTSFFEFGDEAQVVALRSALVQALNRAPLDEQVADRVVAEAVWAFRQHVKLFEDLWSAS